MENPKPPGKLSLELWGGKLWSFVTRNKVTFLFIVFIILQILTWRSVVSVEKAVRLSIELTSTPCGDIDSPCHVIIVPKH
jgi:hypothetical protein